MNTNSEERVPWSYSLLSVSEDKKASRPSVGFGFASELIGVDGNSEGGLRPFRGFRMIRELNPPVTNGLSSTKSFTARSKTIDLFPVSFLVGVSGYGYGFIYRIKKDPAYISANSVAAANQYDVFMDYWDSYNNAWTTGQVVVADCDNSQMSVSFNRSLIYTLISGRSPVLVYLDRASHAFTKVDPAGPGLQPKLRSAEDGVALGTAPALGSEVGTGQIVLTLTTPSSAGLGLTQADVGTRFQDVGDYSFAYQLYDSKTGRRSALSQVAYAREADFSAAAREMVLELVYDNTKFDQAYVYRSVRIQAAGGTYTAGYLHLDKIITLASYHTTTQPGTGKHAVYYYELEDKELVFQDYFLDRQLFDEVMPRGGASHFYGTTLLISKIKGSNPSSTTENRVDDAVRGLGDLRWSSTTDWSPELFPPSNRYLPIIPSNDIIAWADTAGACVGWSLDRQYVVRRDGLFLRVQEMHEGFGVVGPRAVDTVGSSAYFVTTKGLKMVDANGQLEDIKSLNHLIMEEWKDTISGINLGTQWAIQVAFDSQLGALFVFNPYQRRAGVLWFNTARTTELTDMSFSCMARGVWPINVSLPPANSFGDLVGRVFFVQDAPPDVSASTILTSWKPRVHVAAVADTWYLASGSSPINPMFVADFNTVSWFPAFTTTALPSISVPSGISLPVGTTIGANANGTMEGSWLYVLDSSDPTYIGKKTQIYNKIDSTHIRLCRGALTDAGQPSGWDDLLLLPSGSRVGISPVYFRWVGHPVSLQPGEGAGMGPGSYSAPQVTDFHRIKTVQSITGAFVDVTGGRAGTNDAAFQALVYRGSDAIPLATGIPYASTDQSRVPSVQDREGRNAAYFQDSNSTATPPLGVVGNCLCPGVAIFCPDLDYRLLGVLVEGKILGTSRSRNPL